MRSREGSAAGMLLRLIPVLILALTSALVTGCQTASSSASPIATAAVGVDAPSGDRHRWAENASWAPGQLQEHYSKHGREGAYTRVADYDRAARETIINGTFFTYVDRESRAQRLGFYHGPSNRFTSLTADGQRITTFFHPERRDSYVRGLDRSTFK